jgi:hypothetical protein
MRLPAKVPATALATASMRTREFTIFSAKVVRTRKVWGARNWLFVTE